MSLEKQPKFAPSQRPYAINRDSRQQDSAGKVTFLAVWAGAQQPPTATP